MAKINKSNKKLTEAQKQKVYGVIQKKQLSDDPTPREVIAANYGGDEDKYLVDMANFHGVTLKL